MTKESYLEQLKQGNTPPFTCEFPIRQGSNEIQLKLISDVVRILNAEGVEPILIGSASTFLQTDNIYPKKIHDVDFLIRGEHIEGVRRTLNRNGFIFWDEKNIHRNVRNLTGGFGRHHDYGASSEEYRRDSGLPIWLGFFTYSDKTEFLEKYAFSRFKLNLVIESTLEKVSDLNPTIKNRLLILKGHDDLTVESLVETLHLLSKAGIDFWQQIDESSINDRDTRRRQKLPPLQTEKFIEVARTEDYNVTIGEYMRVQPVSVFDTEIKTLDLAINYWRMKKYFPHYLGPREKYIESAGFIEASGYLPEDTQSKEEIYRSRKIRKNPLGIFVFRNDFCLNFQVMQQTPHGLDHPNYWALLLEGVHYATKH